MKPLTAEGLEMETFIAHVLVFFLGPLAALAGVLLMPISTMISIHLSPFLGGFIASLPQTFLAAWFGKLLFGLLGVTPGWGMILTLGIGFMLNDIGQASKHGLSPMKVGYILGDIAGLLLFGFFML